MRKVLTGLLLVCAFLFVVNTANACDKCAPDCKCNTKVTCNCLKDCKCGCQEKCSADCKCTCKCGEKCNCAADCKCCENAKCKCVKKKFLFLKKNKCNCSK